MSIFGGVNEERGLDNSGSQTTEKSRYKNSKTVFLMHVCCQEAEHYCINCYLTTFSGTPCMVHCWGGEVEEFMMNTFSQR